MLHTPEVTTSIVAFEAVSKTFGSGSNAVRALNNVSLEIRANEFFTLLGPSGCGKTTILRLLAGFDHPNAGAIYLNGQEVGHLPPYQRPVNTVFQNYALFPHMTVAENVGFGLEMLGRPKDEIARTVDEMLTLTRMEALKSRRVDQLSGGQAQRVALARALAPRPSVLLLDEPLSALDLKLRKEMQIELKRLQHETGVTFVFVTHDQEEALTMSDRVTVMSAGEILQVGTPHEIYEHPADRFVADFIGDTNFLTAELTDVTDGAGSVTLPGGLTTAAALPSTGAPPLGSVTIVVRPEHAQLAAPGSDGGLPGQIENVVYFGTDTHFHVRLDDCGPFIVRRQNTRAGTTSYETGDRVAIVLEPDAVQVLRD